MKPTTFYDEKILIVDDKEDNILFLHKLLSRSGYTDITTTTTSTDVLGLVKKQEPDIILLDLMMPHLDGFGVMAQVKDYLAEDNYLPILVLTADTDESARQRSLKEGAMDFLSKPLNATEVLQRTHNLLQTRHLYKQQALQKLMLEQIVEEKTKELRASNYTLRVKNEGLENAQLDMLSRLAKAGEYRDDETGEHTFRVARFAYQTALELGFSEHFSGLLLRAARLHDIGKLGIPDHVLLKPGKLSAEERKIVQSHCLIGAQLLSGSNSELLEMARSVALSHHERFDGAGYPYGLSGHQIPIEGRIVAVVDVFDALTHSRPYNDAWTQQEALVYLSSQRSGHFDPDVVDAFLNVLADQVPVVPNLQQTLEMNPTRNGFKA